MALAIVKANAKADLPQGARCLPTCRSLHHSDKSKSPPSPGANAMTIPTRARVPEGVVWWRSEMV